jgi:hypothetical protein
MGNTHGQFDFIGGSYEIACSNWLILFGFAGKKENIPETPVQYGFSATIKSLVVALSISLATIFLLLLWRPTVPPQIVHGTIFQKLSESFLSQKNEKPPVIEQTEPTPKPKDYVFSEKEISTVKEKLIKDRQENSLVEIQLKSGRSIFAKNATINGDILSFENDRGLIISMNRHDVRHVRKIIQK